MCGAPGGGRLRGAITNNKKRGVHLLYIKLVSRRFEMVPYTHKSSECDPDRKMGLAKQTNRTERHCWKLCRLGLCDQQAFSPDGLSV